MIVGIPGKQSATCAEIIRYLTHGGDIHGLIVDVYINDSVLSFQTNGQYKFADLGQYHLCWNNDGKYVFLSCIGEIVKCHGMTPHEQMIAVAAFRELVVQELARARRLTLPVPTTPIDANPGLPAQPTAPIDVKPVVPTTLPASVIQNTAMLSAMAEVTNVVNALHEQVQAIQQEKRLKEELEAKRKAEAEQESRDKALIAQVLNQVQPPRNETLAITANSTPFLGSITSQHVLIAMIAVFMAILLASGNGSPKAETNNAAEMMRIFQQQIMEMQRQMWQNTWGSMPQLPQHPQQQPLYVVDYHHKEKPKDDNSLPKPPEATWSISFNWTYFLAAIVCLYYYWVANSVAAADARRARR